MAKKRQASRAKLRSPEVGRDRIPGESFDGGGFPDEPTRSSRTSARTPSALP